MGEPAGRSLLLAALRRRGPVPPALAREPRRAVPRRAL